ncbi:MAG: hypothetical protein HYZ27_12325 [Deltaproteobacteria bacterium]|nr:hypothetical protein [Deltaproteobacteria bacterium]
MRRWGFLLGVAALSCQTQAPAEVGIGPNTLRPCSEPTQCSSTQTCFEGFCREVCAAPSDCTADEVCNTGVCLRWLFEPMDHGLGDMTLTDVWVRSDGVVFATGWYGTLITNRDGDWTAMSVPTREHLTGIYGVENGGYFNQAAPNGEMFAVGHNGTLLYYHPNPKCFPVATPGCPVTPRPRDGAWQVVAGPGQRLASSLKIDPYCPDDDGDGIADEAGGPAGAADGWWRSADTCVGGATTACDDNCRTTPNGPERPIEDLGDLVGGNFVPGPDGCIEDGADLPYGASRNQTDADADGVGLTCDACEDTTDPLCLDDRYDFTRVLFDVWAEALGDQLRVVAVGEAGALVTYEGANGSVAVVAPALPITDNSAWIAQAGLAYRYADDCPPGTPAGVTCSSRTGRVCSAQCSPYRYACPCPTGEFQCCMTDATLTGAACSGPGCGGRAGLAADNACAVTGTGYCPIECPSCFRRLDKTLRGLATNGSTLVAVGAAGTVATLDLAQGLAGEWVVQDCNNSPPPLDEHPPLTSVSTRGGGFYFTGAAGALAYYPPAGGCPSYTPLCEPPAAFLSGVYATSNSTGYAVGDAGTVLSIDTARAGCLAVPADPYAQVIPTDIEHNILGIWVETVLGRDRLWLVGATGLLVMASYY